MERLLDQYVTEQLATDTSNDSTLISELSLLASTPSPK